MLRCVRLKNFVHFEEEQTIKLDNGANFFIGQNNTGKTSVFEAIHRCMSLSKNSSISTVYNRNEPSIAMCIYKLAGTTDGEDEVFVSSVVTYPELLKESESKCVKLVYKCNMVSDECSDNRLTIGIDLIRLEKEKEQWDIKPLFLSDKQKDVIAKMLNLLEQVHTEDGYKDKFNIDTFCKTIKQSIEAISESPPSTVEHEKSCDQLLTETVDKSTVITFALRNISPKEWTVGSNLGPTEMKKFHKEIQEKANIISWYIHKKENQGDISDEERKEGKEEEKNEEDIFKTLTGRSDFDFRRNENDGGAIYAYDGVSGPISLLRVPEGYYEAKKCSIVLAMKAFKTVCFEDPDRGMHPQMVTRLRDLVLPMITNKVVIIATHNPYFISPITVLRSVLFTKNKESKLATVSAIQIAEKMDQTELQSSLSTKKHPSGNNGQSALSATPHQRSVKSQRIIASPHYSTLFFASRVMFVEGRSDQLFMDELKAIIMSKPNDDDDAVKAVEAIIGKDMDRKRMCQYLSAIEFIPLGGKGETTRFRPFCEAIMLEHMFLFDFDVLTGPDINTEVTDKAKKKREKDFNRFLTTFNLSGPKYEKCRENVEILEKVNIFVWNKHGICKKGGTIEEAIISLDPDPNGELQKFLCEQNARLIKSDTSARGNQKLDNSKLFDKPKLSAENISLSVSKILSISSKSDDTDVNRLVRFLHKKAIADLESKPHVM